MNEWLGRNPPRWILAVVSGPEQTNYIAGRVNETGLPPKPTLIRRKLGELESRCEKLLHPSVQVRTLKVHNDACASYRADYRVERESGIAFGAFEACVAWRRMDDERKAHVAVERDRSPEVRDRERNLIEVHGNLCMRPNA